MFFSNGKSVGEPEVKRRAKVFLVGSLVWKKENEKVIEQIAFGEK